MQNECALDAFLMSVSVSCTQFIYQQTFRGRNWSSEVGVTTTNTSRTSKLPTNQATFISKKKYHPGTSNQPRVVETVSNILTVNHLMLDKTCPQIGRT